jgi:DNA invertase Pin-like site-specific DNA recombinase
MSTKLPQAALPSRLIGYARVSTEEQGTDAQLDELRAAGCATVLEEHASGAEAAGAHFRSLRDPIDTTTPQGSSRCRCWAPSPSS